jgi:hypothetical protein
MPPAGARYVRNDRQHTAHVLEVREQMDRFDPHWHRKRLDQLRAARGAVRLTELSSEPLPPRFRTKLFRFVSDVIPVEVNRGAGNLEECALHMNIGASFVSPLQRFYGVRNLLLRQFLTIFNAEKINHFNEQVRSGTSSLRERTAPDPRRYKVLQFQIRGNRHG